MCLVSDKVDSHVIGDGGSAHRAGVLLLTALGGAAQAGAHMATPQEHRVRVELSAHDTTTRGDGRPSNRG